MGRRHGWWAGRVRIHVRDTGVGIAADRLNAIFEPFYQGERTFNRPMEGVGLGLAISRDLPRGMGGELTVASVLGRGSVFTLALQCGAPGMDCPTDPSAAEAVAG